jgi:hypothetical protein
MKTKKFAGLMISVNFDSHKKVSKSLAERMWKCGMMMLIY